MPHPGFTERRRLLVGALAAAALAGCKPQGAEGFKGVDLTGVAYGREFSLTDHEGQPRTLKDYRGKVLVLFFGFTQCPDVCPSTLGELKLVKQQLGTQGGDVTGLFVTVDPERDTAELLGQYVASFGPDVVGLRGTPEQTQAVAKEFRVLFAKVQQGESYSMDHTAASFLIDRKGRLRVYHRYGAGPEALQHDLQQLLRELA